MDMTFGCRLVSAKKPLWGAHWRHLANMVERSLCSGNRWVSPQEAAMRPVSKLLQTVLSINAAGHWPPYSDPKTARLLHHNYLYYNNRTVWLFVCVTSAKRDIQATIA